MRLPDAVALLRGLEGEAGEAAALVLDELDRERKTVSDVARRVMPTVVGQLGAAAALEEVRGLVPRLIEPPAHRTFLRGPVEG